MTRQKREILKRIEQIREWIDMDTALGCGTEPGNAYEELYKEIHRLEELLPHLCHYESVEEMFSDDIGSRVSSKKAAEKGVDFTIEKYPTRDQVERIRQMYPVGSTIKLYRMADPTGVPPGTTGKVVYVDDAGQIGVRWDNGSSLSLIPGVDVFSRIESIESAKKRLKGGDAR